jgi:hypothetical protein
MAREEHERENLLAEATALVQRVQLDTPDGHSIVVGFRRDGSASIFFDEEPVYQFNSRGELRRAHLDGALYKAEHGRLVRLLRHRVPGEVQLVRRELSDDETNAFMQDVARRLGALAQTLRDSGYRLVGCVPADVDVLGRALHWLDALPSTIAIAQSPNTL